jgi:DNA-binding transcriptional MocR family regulator
MSRVFDFGRAERELAEDHMAAKAALQTEFPEAQDLYEQQSIVKIIPGGPAALERMKELSKVDRAQFSESVKEIFEELRALNEGCFLWRHFEQQMPEKDHPTFALDRNIVMTAMGKTFDDSVEFHEFLAFVNLYMDPL